MREHKTCALTLFRGRVLSLISDLLTPESQADPYVWGAVMLSHAGIGAALWVILRCPERRPWWCVLLAMIVYAVFEAMQAVLAGTFLLWDSLLDWSAVSLGAVLAASLWQRSITFARLAILAVFVIVAIGARGRG